MNRPVVTLSPKVKIKTLAQQNTDFTEEGAPPPDKVAMSIPDAAHEVVKAGLRPASSALGAHKRRS